jgi:hypothetical protein
MTAEVVAMNKLAVALAADSAVSRVYGHGAKTYDTANKLFALSKHEPVGVMVFGNAEINMVPWELVIKTYRRHLGAKTYPSLPDYAEDFIDFLGSSDLLFPEDKQLDYCKHLILRYLYYLRYIIEDEVSKQLEISDLSPREIQKCTRSVIDHDHTIWFQQDTLRGLSSEAVETLHDVGKRLAQTHVAEVFDQLPLDENDIERISEICGALLTRDGFGTNEFVARSSGGIAIAGFGTADVFPSCLAMQVLGVAAGNALHEADTIARVTPESPAYVRGFAQTEMVCSFMEGIEPDIQRLYMRYIHKVVENTISEITRHLRVEGDMELDEVRQRLTDWSVQELDDRHKELREYLYQNRVGPVLDAIEMLPKDQLATLAESLVSLTSLKRRVSTSAETVGGPVDVAVISKGDGFIWLRRKHYFDAKLNPSFFENYFRDGQTPLIPTKEATDG